MVILTAGLLLIRRFFLREKFESFRAWRAALPSLILLVSLLMHDFCTWDLID